MAIVVREVAFGGAEYREVLAIRDEVLRKPINMILRDADTALDHAEFHVAAFDGERMVGCVLLRPLGNRTIKLRQMAVLDSHRKQGIGAQLVHFAEALSLQRGFTHIEANARETARDFYEKLGYHTHGERFIEVGLPTVKMHKRLGG